MSTIPGHPLAAFLGSTRDHGNELSSVILSTLQDADVILGRDIATQQEFVVFGREILQRVAGGDDEADGYNVLCIEIDRHQGSPDLELLIALVQSVKGGHDFIDYGGTEEPTSAD